MRDPQELISWFGTPSWNDADAPLVCVHAFTGFLDAGQATEHAVRAIKGDSARLLVEFDPDELVDYRARRPSLTYVTDHFESVDWPQIGLYEVTDMNGRRFWLLTGPEPDYQWQRFIAAVTDIVEGHGIDLMVGLSGVPWPTPHTRPLGATVHGSDPRLLPAEESLLGTLQVPGHMSGLLELRLGQEGHDCIGIAAHVPHYLTQVDYPRAAITMLDALEKSTGLRIDTSALVPPAERAEAEISAQVEQSEEFAAVLSALEGQYDQARQMQERASSELLSGDEIAAQVEQFLAEMEAQGEADEQSE